MYKINVQALTPTLLTPQEVSVLDSIKTRDSLKLLTKFKPLKGTPLT
jgi:hypothetical protein